MIRLDGPEAGFARSCGPQSGQGRGRDKGGTKRLHVDEQAGSEQEWAGRGRTAAPVRNLETVMTAPEPDVQWYIARDGRQYGPVSAVEMAKLVELNHLKPTDLLWRPGFADWRPALTVFPAAVPPPALDLPAAPAPSNASTAGRSSVQRAAPAPSMSGAELRSAPVQAEARHAPGPSREPVDARPAAAPAATEAAKNAALRASQATGSGRDGDGAGRGWGSAKVAAAVVVLVVAGAGGYVLLKGGTGTDKKDATPVVVAASGPNKVSAPGNEARGPDTASTKTAAVPESAASLAAPTASSPAAPGGGSSVIRPPLDATEIEKRLQQSEVWRFIKRDYADWYGARMREVTGLPGEQRTEQNVDKHLVAALVGLRRENADKALAASTEKLKRVASAFLDNLHTLAGRDVNACFNFISQGESSSAVVQDLVQGAASSPIQKQIIAILEAIGEGAKSPHDHEKPQKADYDALAEQLTKLGWTQNDLQLFADPKALARAEPAKVCKMVQDWFAAHLAISDAAVQERLLVETLRPVVAG